MEAYIGSEESRIHFGLKIIGFCRESGLGGREISFLIGIFSRRKPRKKDLILAVALLWKSAIVADLSIEDLFLGDFNPQAIKGGEIDVRDVQDAIIRFFLGCKGFSEYLEKSGRIKK